MTISLIDPDGLLLPYDTLAKTARAFRSSIVIVCDGQAASPKSLTSLYALRGGRYRMVVIRADGPDAEAAVATLARLLLNGCEAE